MDKYLIFLPNRFIPADMVGCFCFTPIRRGIINDLLDRGITIRYRDDIRRIIDEGRLSFDDDISPKLNTLYIHLLGGDYYSDTNYGKKKTEREREILFLLAAKLGVSSITYNTDVIETTISKISGNIDAHDVKTQATYSKKCTTCEGKSGTEHYINRGAPIYTLSKNINQVEDNINRQLSKLKCKIFSREFYENNARLKSFVYKRFNFKMSHVEYTTEVENDLDVCFDVRTTLLSYGIGMSFEKQTIQTERITYIIKFFEDKELRLQLSNIIHLVEDPFAMIREIYDSEDNKDIAIYHITEYVRKYANRCKLVYITKNGRKISENYCMRLNKWIHKNGVDKFAKQCHIFTSSYQIRVWFRQEFVDEKEQIIDDHEDEPESDIENYGILRLKKENYDRYKRNVMEADDYTSSAFYQTWNDKKAPVRSRSTSIDTACTTPEEKCTTPLIEEESGKATEGEQAAFVSIQPPSSSDEDDYANRRQPTLSGK
jgi:hypothetical protein